MTNAYKHAFEGRQQGTLTVSVTVHDTGELTASVTDDGIGASTALEPARKGVGGALFDAFARQLGARRNRAPGPVAGTRLRSPSPAGR